MNTNFETMNQEEAKNIALDTLREVKEVVISTIDKDGKPASRIIDIMFRDEDELYFMTCNVKPFYFELKKQDKIAITAMTKDWLQVRLQGSFKELDNTRLQEIYDRNPSLAELFDRNAKANNVAIYTLNQGKGEVFDISGDRVKVQRTRFSFGNGQVNNAGCVINDNCINCGKCIKVCPFSAITKGNDVHEINPNYCDECGMCYHECPVSAIELPTGM